MKVVIIGGVAGGMSAATRLRRLDEHAEIVVLERGPHVSYANCGLPYHIGGVITKREALLLQTPQSLRSRFAIDVRVRSEAVSIDRVARTVRVRDLEGGTEYSESYDHLVLSPGARPLVPPVPGAERAMTLRDVSDTDRILEEVADGAKSAVVIGAGFVGVELAENLRERGMQVAVVELGAQVLPPLDPEMSHRVRKEMADHGVELHLGTQVTKILPESVELSSGKTLPADLVFSAIGVAPDTALAKASGLQIGPRGGITVDDCQRTSDPRVYAVGDAAEKLDAVTSEPTLIPLANLANRHGRLTADAILGRPLGIGPAIGTAIVQVFSLSAAATGWNEKRLQAAERPYRALHIHPGCHAGYYPGGSQLTLKLLIDPETEKILGAQAVGKEGVDKRIDVIATAMAGGLTAPELADLELAYAPPYGSAKDPVNMLGYVAENVANGSHSTIQWHELDERVAAGGVLVDVRTKREFEAGAIPGALNIPVDDLRSRLGELPADRDIIIYCQAGLRGYIALRLLSQHGFSVTNVDGGYLTWRAGQESLQK